MNLGRMLRNASANIARILVSMVAALILPRLLLQTLSPSEYGVWVLILQISLYAGYLDIGISTVVGRFVAYHKERNEVDQLNGVFSSGLLLMAGMGVLAMAGFLVALIALPRIFPEIPAEIIGDARLTLALVALTTALRLPSTIINAVFIGLQRNEYPLAFLLANKTLLLLFMGIVALLQGSLIMVGVAYAALNLLMYVFELAALRRNAEKVRFEASLVSWQIGRKIISNSLGFAVWIFGGLLISGLDMVIVGAFDFASVVAFSFAVTLTALVTQVQSAAVSVLMPVAATLSGKRDDDRLTALMVRGTRYGLLMLLMIGVPLIAAAASVVTLWVGQEFVADTVPILIALVIAAIIRQSALSFAMVVVGVGRQNTVVLSPLLGGLVNVVVSVVATMRMGAIGAAFGTIVGGLVEVGLHIFFNLPRIPELRISPRTYFGKCFLQPVVFASPGIALVLLWYALGDPSAHMVQSILMAVAAALLIGLSGWFFVLEAQGRRYLLAFVEKIQLRLRFKTAQTL